MTRLPSAILALILAHAAHAQIFHNFFGGGGGGGGGPPREQEAPPVGDASWFEARVDAARCATYLCPRTLSCVSHPARCPCPFPHQIRCAYPDGPHGLEGGGGVCVSAEDCADVERFRTVGSKFKLADLK